MQQSMWREVQWADAGRPNTTAAQAITEQSVACGVGGV